MGAVGRKLVNERFSVEHMAKLTALFFVDCKRNYECLGCCRSLDNIRMNNVWTESIL